MPAPGHAQHRPGLPDVPGYEVLGELGRGGMGVVYQARQVKLNRLVALKMILAGAEAGATELARFRSEAEAIARLAHPNIVHIYEVGEHEGRPFFSLEFCPGGSLDRKLGGNPLPPREAAQVVEVLAHAVHAAHQQQVIHRDLKPANVLLGADGALKVTDFGLAKRLDQSGQTQYGVIMGTPSYMAPEQASGNPDEVGPVSDVYALAAILYECLTGHPPFKAATARDTVAQLLTQEPVPPSRLQPKVPADLETICLKGLQKEARRRYASARDLADDLRRFLDGQPIRARPVGFSERAVKWARRRPAAAGLVAAVALAVLATTLGGLSYGLYKGQQATALRQQLERRQKIDRLWDQGKEAEAAGELALARGQEAEADRQFTVAAQHWDQALATLDADADAPDDELRRQLVERREQVRQRLEEQALQRQAQAREERFLARRVEVLVRELSFTNRERAANREHIRQLAPAALALVGVRADRPPADAGRALEPGRSLPGGQASRLAAGCYEVLLVWAEAEAAPLPGQPEAERRARARLALRLLEMAAALGRAHGLATPRAFHARRARYLAQLGDEAGARAERSTAERLRPRTALDSFLAGLESYRQGQSRAAIATCEEALRQQPDHFWAQYLQALCYLKEARGGETRAALTAAKAGLTACQARRPALLWPRLLRAYAAAELGEFSAAEEDFAQALRRANDPLRRCRVLTNRGAMWVRRKRWDEAVADLKEAIRLRPEAPQAYVNLAQAHRGRNDPDSAVRALGRAIALRPEDAGLYYTRARVHLGERDDPAAARRDFERVVALGGGPPGSRARLELASARVELGHLKHQSREYRAALADFDAALGLLPDYPPAHRQRAETLLALGRHAEAGRALDRYLARGTPVAEAYTARGLIHTKLGEHRQAIEAYSRALARSPDATTLGYRGWAYLRVESPRLALADFDAALKGAPANADALCGRAHARVRLGEVKEAVRDAEEAVRQGPPAERLLCSLACVYAQAAGRPGPAPGPGRAAPAPGARYADRAVELVARALRQVPQERREAFWRQHVQPEPALAPIRLNGKMLRLARGLGR